MNEDEDIINYFQSMSPEEQDKLKPDEMKFIDDAMNRQLQKKNGPPVQDSMDARGGANTKIDAVDTIGPRKTGPMEGTAPKMSFTDELQDMAKKTASLPLSGMGVVNGVKALTSVAKGGPLFDPRSGENAMNQGYTAANDSMSLGGTKLLDTKLSDDPEATARYHDEASSANPATVVMSPFSSAKGIAGQLKNVALGTGMGAMTDTKNPIRGAEIGAGASVGIPAAAMAIKAVASRIGEAGLRELALFIGLPMDKTAKLAADGELEPLIETLEKNKVLQPFQGPGQSAIEAQKATNESGSELGKIVAKMPNMHNNELSGMFDEAANSQNMTGVGENHAQDYLKDESARWANRKGMTGFDPTNEVNMSTPNSTWVNKIPIPQKGTGMIMPDVTAGNPTPGVGANEEWVSGDPIRGSGFTVPEVTAPQIHNERKAIDKRLFDASQPAGGAIKTNESEGLEQARQVYSDALERQAEKSGLNYGFQKANKLHSDLTTAKTGLNNRVDSFTEYGKNHPFVQPVSTAVEHARSAVGLSAVNMAKSIRNSRALLQSKDAPRLTKIIELVLNSDNPEVEHEIASQTFPEYNRLTMEWQKEKAEDNE